MHVKIWSFALYLMASAPLSAQGWQGPYVGIHLGGVSADFSHSSLTVPGPGGEARSALGGLQLGYNWQHGNTILGAEADVSMTDISDQFAGGQFEEELMTSLRLRAGLTQGETLVFGSMGVAWTEQQTTVAGAGQSSELAPGFVLGAGAERFLWSNVTGRVEAYYLDTPTETQNIGGTTISGGSQNVIFRAGLSLHF